MTVRPNLYSEKNGPTYTTFTVSEGYNFTASGPGAYDFSPDSKFYVVGEGEKVEIVQAETPKTYTTQVEGPTLAVARRDEHSSGHLSKRATFVSCSSSRQALINTAAASAETYAANAKAYLTANTASTTRFTTWFGSFTAAHRTTVLSHFTKIDSNTFSSFTYDCSCTDSSYAYVYAGR